MVLLAMKTLQSRRCTMPQTLILLILDLKPSHFCGCGCDSSVSQPVSCWGVNFSGHSKAILGVFCKVVVSQLDTLVLSGLLLGG
eukprot:m.478511 g.478511  ORF g.478511 m.478511 type:complete len:84 (+) comp46845_c0_seq1:168-419(+)